MLPTLYFEAFVADYDWPTIELRPPPMPIRFRVFDIPGVELVTGRPVLLLFANLLNAGCVLLGDTIPFFLFMSLGESGESEFAVLSLSFKARMGLLIY